MGAEDFSYMLEKVPGAMVMLGNGGGPDAASLHNPRYDFNDMAIPFGVSFFVRTVERFLGEKQRLSRDRAGRSDGILPRLRSGHRSAAGRDAGWRSCWRWPTSRWRRCSSTSRCCSARSSTS